MRPLFLRWRSALRVFLRSFGAAIFLVAACFGAEVGFSELVIGLADLVDVADRVAGSAGQLGFSWLVEIAACLPDGRGRARGRFRGAVCLHVFEQALTLAAIFDQWVTLADAHPVDAFAEVIHVFEVLHPEVVENLQVDITLNFAHDFGVKAASWSAYSSLAWVRSTLSNLSAQVLNKRSRASSSNGNEWRNMVFELLGQQQRRVGQYVRLFFDEDLDAL